MSRLSGRAYDVATGRAIKGVTLKLYQNGRVVATRDVGRGYQIAVVPGVYTLKASRPGFVTSSDRVSVAPSSKRTFNLMLSKTLSAGQARIVLNWGDSPRDLDAYLRTPQNHHTCVVSWRKMACHDNDVSLDVDAVASHGPETITIKRMNTHGNLKYAYHYSVKQFSADGLLKQSGAVVRVFLPNGRIHTFKAATHGRYLNGGKTWEVFKMSSTGAVEAIGGSGFGYVFKRGTAWGSMSCPGHYPRVSGVTACRQAAQYWGYSYQTINSNNLHHGCQLTNGNVVRFNHGSGSCHVCRCGRPRVWPFSGCHVRCGAKCSGQGCCCINGWGACGRYGNSAHSRAVCGKQIASV